MLIMKSLVLATVALKPELFEGMRFEFNKALSPKFFLSHRYLLLLFASFTFVFMYHHHSWVSLHSSVLNDCLINFFSVVMGPTEIPSQSTETIKIPTAQYEFGANFVDPKVSEIQSWLICRNGSMLLHHRLILQAAITFMWIIGCITEDAHW